MFNNLMINILLLSQKMIMYFGTFSIKILTKYTRSIISLEYPVYRFMHMIGFAFYQLNLSVYLMHPSWSLCILIYDKSL